MCVPCLPAAAPTAPLQGEDKAAEYWAAHGEAEAATGACKGAHLLYISRLVQKRGKVRAARAVHAVRAANTACCRRRSERWTKRGRQP